MPRNTLSILLRFSKNTESLGCNIIASQDIISFNQGKVIEAHANFFDDEPVDPAEMGGDDYDEGDKMKALVTGQVEHKNEISDYLNGLEARLKDYATFLGEANLKAVQPVRVIHCPQAHGVVITSNYGSFSSYQRMESKLQWRL